MRVNLTNVASGFINRSKNASQIVGAARNLSVKFSDTVDFADEELQKEARRVFDVLSETRDDNLLAKLPKIIYFQIARLIRHSNLQKDYRYAEYTTQMGKNLQILALRRHLLESAPEKNSFALTVHDTALRSNYSNAIIPHLNFYELIRQTPKSGGERRVCSNIYFAMLNIIYKYTSDKKVAKFLSPYFEKALNTDSSERYLNILRAFFMGTKQCDKKFIHDTLIRSDGRYTATGYANGEKLGAVTANTVEEAEISLFKGLMREFGIYPLNPENKTLNKGTIFNIPNIRDTVLALLSRIGFVQTAKRTQERVDRGFDCIVRAFIPDLKNNDFLMHQKLEYYGDAVLNLFVERFLQDKKLPIQSKKFFYGKLKSNQIVTEYFDQFKLGDFLVHSEKDNPKIKADTFEALMGSLHLTYSEDDVYAFFRPILEAKYQELVEKFGIKAVTE